MPSKTDAPPTSLRQYHHCTETELNYLLLKANRDELESRKLLCVLVELYRRSSHNRLFDLLRHLAELK